jgi:hypothetical protein
MLSTEACNNSTHEMGRALHHLFLKDGAVSIFNVGAFGQEDSTCYRDLFQSKRIFKSIKKINPARVASSFYLKKKTSLKFRHFLSSCIITKSNTR